MPRKKTQEEVIAKFIEVHGNKYDYSKVEYINSYTKVCIICPIHGEFYIKPNDHLQGFGCSKCSKKYKPTTQEFIEKAQKVHGNKYDYSKVEYVNSHTKICIICPIHGEFWQMPYKHINSKMGCPKCSGLNRTKQEFIEMSQIIHGDKYDYSKVEYINSKTKVCIICHKHGEFWQTPNTHLQGHGCVECGILTSHEKLKQDFSVFLEKATEIHGNKYDYSKVEYINNKTKVCIICPIHGEF